MRLKRIKLIILLLLIFILNGCNDKNIETNINRINFNDIKFIENYNYIKKKLKISDKAKIQNFITTVNNNYY
ncbi:hypothetical protein, partial [Caldisalinibacter kiritimatiensis]|uniref:hypothetical protein n=1 Tax=Caldisalinibacter kiritimatiensis TaxID=1304284 RepID=UPI000551921D